MTDSIEAFLNSEAMKKALEQSLEIPGTLKDHVAAVFYSLAEQGAMREAVAIVRSDKTIIADTDHSLIAEEVDDSYFPAFILRRE